MKRWIGVAAALLVTAACSERGVMTTAPAAPHFSVAGDSGGGHDTTALHGLQWRSDSTMRSAYVLWNVADTNFAVSFAEGMQSGQRVALLSYGVYTWTQCGDWWSGYWACPAYILSGFSYVDPRTITGGQGMMAIAASDSVGEVRITLHQAGAPVRSTWHEWMPWWPLWAMINSTITVRPATASGQMFGLTVPANAQAFIVQNSDHSIVIAKNR